MVVTSIFHKIIPKLIELENNCFRITLLSETFYILRELMFSSKPKKFFSAGI